MFNNSTGFTMPVAPIGYGYGGGYGMNGFGGDWWGIIVLLALLGWGGNGGFGFGGFGGRCTDACATQADVRAAVDQQTLISKLDQQTYGLADATFALNNTIVNGFHGVDNAICTLGYQNQQGFNALSSQLAMCCCDIERGIDGVNYNLATHICDVKNTMNNNTRDIIDNQNCNTKAVLDFLIKDKIDTLQAENQSLKLAASQAKQNQYLIDELRPCPVPAFLTCNPYASIYGYNGYNNGFGCGCNNGF